MNRRPPTNCALYEGHWKVTPTRDVIINCLSRAFRGRPWDRWRQSSQASRQRRA